MKNSKVFFEKWRNFIKVLKKQFFSVRISHFFITDLVIGIELSRVLHCVYGPAGHKMRRQLQFFSIAANFISNYINTVLSGGV